MALASVFIFAPAAEAKASTAEVSSGAASASQVRVRYVTRNVTRGRRVFRETYRVSRYRNGRIVRQLVSRQRIGRVGY